MSNDLEHSSGDAHSSVDDVNSGAKPDVSDEPPVFSARYSRLDENGKMREYVRTRGGREIRVLNESDAEWFEKNCPYDPDL